MASQGARLIRAEKEFHVKGEYSMLQNMVRKLFNLAVMAIALCGPVWLVAGASALFIEILLLVNGTLLAALVFGFRLAEGSNPQSLSIWTGPVPRRRAGG